MYFYSIIIPLFNRPDEIRELLESLLDQQYTRFEVLVVEDGSANHAQHIVESYTDQLPVRYFYKENSGPGFTRNYGFAHAKGDYLIMFDSDCLIPAHYLKSVDDHLQQEPLHAFGGPDVAHPQFTPIQRAIGHSMTSLFTTGGIRGKKQHVGQFYPRSFNMGISREVYETTKGFSSMRYGEDIEFSIRIITHGFTTGLIPDAYVYHKRRTSFDQFFWQVYHSGEARINLYKLYPNELQLVHFFPSAFTIFFGLTIISPLIHLTLFWVTGALFVLYAFLILVESAIKNKSLQVGSITILTSFIQLLGYGCGFLVNFWRKVMLGQNETIAEYPNK